MFIIRKRLRYLILVIGVIIIGLLSRELSSLFPKWVGSILWGLMVFFFMGFIFKDMGSWSYPEDAFAKIWGVPLYSGFMYASVASYICQAWKRLELKFINWPSAYATYSIAVLIYINFFAHHFLSDMRWCIILILLFVFGKSRVSFKLAQCQYSMQVIHSFLLHQYHYCR